MCKLKQINSYQDLLLESPSYQQRHVWSGGAADGGGEGRMADGRDGSRTAHSEGADGNGNPCWSCPRGGCRDPRGAPQALRDMARRRDLLSVGSGMGRTSPGRTQPHWGAERH